MQIIKSEKFTYKSIDEKTKEESLVEMPLDIYGTIDEPLFLASDVGKILLLTNIHVALKNIPSQLKKKHISKSYTSQGERKMTFLTEAALYMLIFRSHSTIADKFTLWVASEILPALRKTGTFGNSCGGTFGNSCGGHFEITYKQNYPMLVYNMETERDLQIKTVNFIRQIQNEKELIFNASFGEDQTTSEIRLEKYRLGYTAGIPDLILFNPTKKYTGCIVEFKSPKGGRLSENQEKVCEHFRKLKYKVIISNNYDHIIIKLNSYIESVRIPCLRCSNKFKSKTTLKNHLKWFHHDS